MSNTQKQCMDHQFSIQPGTTQTFHKINLGMMQEQFEDTKGVTRSRKSKISKG